MNRQKETAEINEGLDAYKERLRELEHEGYTPLVLMLHVWSGSDYNAFYRPEHISEALDDFHRRIDIDDHSRLYVDIDHEGHSVVEDCLLSYDPEEGVRRASRPC